MSGKLLKIANRHGTKPPEWVSEPCPEGSVLGYFENAVGEQWVVLCTPDEIRLTGGDIDWETKTYGIGRKLTPEDIVTLTLRLRTLDFNDLLVRVMKHGLASLKQDDVPWPCPVLARTETAWLLSVLDEFGAKLGLQR